MLLQMAEDFGRDPTRSVLLRFGIPQQSMYDAILLTTLHDVC